MRSRSPSLLRRATSTGVDEIVAPYQTRKDFVDLCAVLSGITTVFGELWQQASGSDYRAELGGIASLALLREEGIPA
jgi:hypothetical protein